ncbi:MAG: hypothetical protein HY703_13350, partial [Gemmatimonadetes bacterium]|nr:hypothetical protein [Gemmatimonadota bacterium]
MLAYAPAAVWAAFLLLLGSRPDLPAVASPFPLDKLAHLLLYGLLGLLAGLGWRAAGRRPAWVWPLMGALLVGILDE